MVLFNYSTKELTAKIVYYGPGLCGKTTNLQFIYENLPEDVKGKMLSLATKTDRTLFFDFLPMDLGEIRGMRTRVQLYTVPGQVFYNETRKLVLKGADGIVFVADSQEQMMGTNIESLRNLEENLKAHGARLGDIPHVLQFNKRDLPRLSRTEDLNTNLNRYNAPCFEAVATTGVGVQETLKGIAKLVLLNLTRRYQPKAASASSEKATTVPLPPEPVVAPSAGTGSPLPRAAAARSVPEASGPQPHRSGSIPVSPLRAAQATKSHEPPPPVLAGGALAAGVKDHGLPPLGERDVDEMVAGLRESEEAVTRSDEDGYFLGESEADSANDAAIMLTDVASDRDLFGDPSLEVARLTAGETREIVVPVEVRHGASVRRFKLSLRLRLDPLD